MRSNRNKTKKIRITTLIITLLFFTAVFYFWNQNEKYKYFINNPVDSTNSQKIIFIIEKGENLTQIAQKLKEKDLILNIDALKKYTKKTDNDKKIVAGKFLLQKNQTIPEIIETITNPRQTEEVITILEGHTVEDINSTLKNASLIDSTEFIDAVKNFDNWEKYPFLDKESQQKLIYPLEGYLFPDTYFVDPLNFYSENLIQLMLNNFENKLSEELEKKQSRDLKDIIIMASIIEKEVRTDKDIKIVSGILWKRLDSDWLVGADATLLYLKTDRTLDYKALQEESQYNTRKKMGLPIGPICNPGLKSIIGALYPEESPYWYYLTTLDTGEVIYARTNDEHNSNKRKYL